MGILVGRRQGQGELRLFRVRGRQVDSGAVRSWSERLGNGSHLGRVLFGIVGIERRVDNYVSLPTTLK